jgi:RimJ/RimL family protein N-acetyltransferase
MDVDTVLLRRLDPERDGPALHAIFGDEESCRYLSCPPFASVGETIAQLKAWSGPDDDTSWAVVDSPDSAALGRVSLFTHGRDIWEAACMIVPAARGRNLAAKALSQAIEFVFEEKSARRVFADCDPDNAASIRTFERLGFRREGLLRGNWETHIGVRDSAIFGLLRDDPRPWRASAPKPASG